VQHSKIAPLMTGTDHNEKPPLSAIVPPVMWLEFALRDLQRREAI
jgi:hypothetical protein